MKKYYIAANILGAVEIRADSPQDAHRKANKFLSKRFQLQPKPTGLWVFEKNSEGQSVPVPPPDAGIGTGT
jgi:hypothetical protein